MLPTKEAPTGNAPVGAIPHQAVNSHVFQQGKTDLQRLQGSFFDPTTGEEGMDPSSKRLLKILMQSTSRRSPPFFLQRLANKQLFFQGIKPYHQGLRTAFPLKAQLGQFSLIISEYKALPKDQALSHCIQSLLSKNVFERVGNVKSLGFYNRLFLVLCLTKVEAFYRLKQALHFSTCRKGLDENPKSIRTSLIPGEWVASIDLSDAYLHIPIHPHSRKYLRFFHRSQVFQFTSLPFGLTTGWSGLSRGMNPS